MEYSILKKEKTWANIKVQNRASQATPQKLPRKSAKPFIRRVWLDEMPAKGGRTGGSGNPGKMVFHGVSSESVEREV